MRASDRPGTTAPEQIRAMATCRVTSRLARMPSPWRHANPCPGPPIRSWQLGDRRRRRTRRRSDCGDRRARGERRLLQYAVDTDQLRHHRQDHVNRETDDNGNDDNGDHRHYGHDRDEDQDHLIHSEVGNEHGAASHWSNPKPELTTGPRPPPATSTVTGRFPHRSLQCARRRYRRRLGRAGDGIAWRIPGGHLSQGNTTLR